jgi:hypothetical protein
MDTVAAAVEPSLAAPMLREPRPAPAAWWSGRLAWWTILALAVGLRVALFSGYGLGDDPNYFSAYGGILRDGTWNEHAAYDFRFTFWAGVVAFLKLFGTTEWGWVGFITLCSVLNVPLTYALARQEWERPWAMLAMLLIAVFPLEVLTSTLFAVDIPLATYCYAGLWLYRVGCDRRRRPPERTAAAVGAGLLLFAGFSAKQWGVLIGAIVAIEALVGLRETWRTSLVTGGTFVALLAGYFGWQWVHFGDPLYDVHLVRSVALFRPHTWKNQTDYLAMLFAPSAYGTWFAGWYPHALVLLALVFAARVRRTGKWFLYFVIELVLLSAAPSHYDAAKGGWVILVPHIFRYLCFLSIPLCLALASYLREVGRSWGTPGLVATAALVAWTVVQAVALCAPTRDTFGEQRRANAIILSTYPDEIVWSDFGFLGRLETFAPDRRGPARGHEIRAEDPAGQARELGQVTDGVVVTGGARLPWYGCIRCAVSVASFRPPPTWRLVAMYREAEMTPYRREPLRIWRVSPSVQRADELLAQRPDEAGRLAILRELVATDDFATAAEVGRRLMEYGIGPRGSVAFMTGFSCARLGYPLCARAHYARAMMDDAIAPAEARRIVEATILDEDPDEPNLGCRWLQLLHARFPAERVKDRIAARCVGQR